MLELLRYTMFFVLWFVIFFNATQQFASVAEAVENTNVWSNWGQWSACNEHDTARRTRYRKCIDWNGKVSSPSRCVGLSKRTRQCESCASPLLNRNGRRTSSSATNVDDFNITSSGFRATKTSLCTSLLSDGSTYVEISFVNFVQLTGIGTWGNRESGYVKKYKIKYSYDGKTWLLYTNSAGKEELLGNTDATGLRDNKFESRLVTRYIRVYPTSSTTHACLNVELYGCEYNCGGLITRDATLLRPPSASRQIEEVNCLWRVDSESATKLQLKFSYFRLLCENGILELFDGSLPYSPTKNDANLVEAFCGQSGKISSQMFEGKSLWIYYRSNATTANTGFKIQVNSYVFKTFNTTSAKVVLPHFSSIYRYVWIIKAPRENDTIQLTLHYFVTNNTRIFAGKCVADAIVIHHGNQGETLVKKYCDTTKYPKVLNSTNGFFKIKYKAKTYNPKWKIEFSYKIIGYPTKMRAYTTTQSNAKEDKLITVYKRRDRSTSEIPSNKLNDTNLEAAQRKERRESSSKVPIIVSCVLAALIAAVCVIALIHYRKRREEYLRKHPYDCSNRPMSHFGDEDATPFINTNLLMWSDSKKSGNSDKPKHLEKSKKSLPVVEVTIRENEPQRLSIIPPEMLKSNSEISVGLHGNEDNNTLKVSDNFTEECMKLLNKNLEGDNEDNPQEMKYLLPGMVKDDERYGSLPEADRRSPEVDDTSPEDSLPEAEGHSP